MIRAIVNRLGIIVAVPFFLSACETYEGYRQIMDAWVGAHADALVASWGAPDGFYENSDGSRVLKYSSISSHYFPGATHSNPVTRLNWDGSTTTTYNSYTTPGYTVSSSCTSTFFTDPTHYIVRWTAEGDDCVAEEAISPDGTRR